VREVRGRFTGYVALPSRVTVRARAGEGGIVFDAVNEAGAPVLAGGLVRA
jgi:hypothetical protein